VVEPQLPRTRNTTITHDAAGILGLSGPNTSYLTLDRIGRRLGLDDGGRLWQPAHRPVEPGVLRSPGFQVGVGVVDVQQGHLLGRGGRARAAAYGQHGKS
jgi:hypothetical protein